jgi:F-type H+-transporting ATPase subunit delta
MNNPRLAGRYAKSLLGLAIEQNQLDAIYNDIKFLKSVCTTNPDFVAVLDSPIIKADKKEKIVSAITKDRVGIITSAFIRLLMHKGRESSIPEITTAFIDQYNEIKDIHRVKITTAVPVSDEIKKSIIEKVKASSNINNIELEASVKEELIGGFILETEGKLVDASVLRDLKDMKRQFLDNDYVSNIR